MSSSSDEEKGEATVSWPTSSSSYVLKGMLGEGAFAKVYQAKCPSVSETSDVAIKVVKDESGELLDSIQKEAATLISLKHANITTCHVSFVVSNELWIVMEMCVASCSDILERVPCFRRGFRGHRTLATVLRDVLLGLQYCHGNGRIHRDIKARNLLLTADGVTKLADFGVSAALWSGGVKKKPSATAVAGTPHWMSPEAMLKKGYDHKTDIWSLGITALELAFGKTPFHSLKPTQVMIAVTDTSAAEITVDSMGKNDFPKSFKSFVSSCLKRDPSARPTVKELLAHKFMKNADSDHRNVADKVVAVALKHGISQLKDELPDSVLEEVGSEPSLFFRLSSDLSETDIKVAAAEDITVEDDTTTIAAEDTTAAVDTTTAEAD